MKKTDKIFKELYMAPVNENERFMEFAGELYNSEQIQSLKQYEQHLEIDRLQHITAVARTATKICDALAWETHSAARAAVLHDLFYYDWRDGTNGKWHRLHGYKHPKYAELNAGELCADLSEKEKKIIRRHMWPLTVLPPTSLQGLAVSLADKFCASLELLYSLGVVKIEEGDKK